MKTFFSTSAALNFTKKVDDATFDFLAAQVFQKYVPNLCDCCEDRFKCFSTSIFLRPSRANDTKSDLAADYDAQLDVDCLYAFTYPNNIMWRGQLITINSIRYNHGTVAITWDRH